MIMMAVALINTEGLSRAALVEQGIADIREGAPPNLRRCNVSSVAIATGLNRETTRRKINQLCKLKLLARSEDGQIHLHPELTIREQMAQTVQTQLETFAKTGQEFLYDGTLKLMDGIPSWPPE